jgi:His-Xaa-Ser system radical SAM maturase HxsB
MSAIPLHCRSLDEERTLFVNDNGRFFAGSNALVERMSQGALTDADRQWLRLQGHLVDDNDAFARDAHAFAVSERLTRAGRLDYLILVPTLRCNLACSYCQVSRANEHARGFDWSDETLAKVLEFIGEIDSPAIKIEFQGGEPTLRPDLISRVIDVCDRFEERQFVICTNLHRLDEPILELLDRPDVFISTSLDGDLATHDRQRTKGEGANFFANLEELRRRYGPGKIHALPTIDGGSPPDPDSLIDAFARFGFTSIFLRPINYQGFARKRHRESREQDSSWRAYHEAFVRKLIARNWADRAQVLEETYFSICLRRIFKPGSERHVDLRNPNPAGEDYLLIDYDGTIYPTDEARMLTRSRVIDLSLGRVGEDWRGETWRLLNEHSTNQFASACKRCAYQPYCGRDLIDDLSRYGRIDVERTTTDFCRKHLSIFDLIFELVYDLDPAVQYSLSRWLDLPGEPRLGEVLE